MNAEEALGYEYEEITDSGVVLRERRAGYSTYGYDFHNANLVRYLLVMRIGQRVSAPYCAFGRR